MVAADEPGQNMCMDSTTWCPSDDCCYSQDCSDMSVCQEPHCCVSGTCPESQWCPAEHCLYTAPDAPVDPVDPATARILFDENDAAETCDNCTDDHHEDQYDWSCTQPVHWVADCCRDGTCLESWCPTHACCYDARGSEACYDSSVCFQEEVEDCCTISAWNDC